MHADTTCPIPFSPFNSYLIELNVSYHVPHYSDNFKALVLSFKGILLLMSVKLK